MFYVYIYKDPITNKPFYVGKGSGDRYVHHLKETKENTTNYLKWCKLESLREKGLSPAIEIVHYSEDEHECLDFEEELIKLYGRKVDGGLLTNMVIDRMPPTAKSPRSTEYCANLSKAKLGAKNPMYGKIPWNYHVPCREETRMKIGKANKGRKYTIEEHKKRNATRGKLYEIVLPDGTIEVVKNVKQWALQKGLCYTNLRQALTGFKGKRSYKGYTGRKLTT